MTDPVAFRSVETAVHTFDAYRKTNPDSLVWSPPSVIKKLETSGAVSYTHLRAHETVLDLVCRLLLEKKKKSQK